MNHKLEKKYMIQKYYKRLKQYNIQMMEWIPGHQWKWGDAGDDFNRTKENIKSIPIIFLLSCLSSIDEED
jgi:hypothetical protein